MTPGLPDRSRSRAVLIGTSRYAELPQVPAAANSLESMRRLLTGPLCGWPPDLVTVIAEPERPGDLPDQLVETFEAAKDVALFYYVGHGQVDFEDQLCLGLGGSRVKSERRATTSLTFEAVRRALRASSAETKVVILDCCFAGHAVHSGHTLSASASQEPDVSGLVSASGAYTLAATGPASTAWFEAEGGSLLPHTHFTRALVETVSRGIPGAPEALTLEPIFRRTREVLQGSGRPVPTRSSRDLAGDFVFAVNAGFAPGPVPASTPAVTHDPGRTQRLLDAAEEAARELDDQMPQIAGSLRIARVADPKRRAALVDDVERIADLVAEATDRARLHWMLADLVVAADPSRAREHLAAFEREIRSDEVSQDSRDWEIGNVGGDNVPALLRLDPDLTERLAQAIDAEAYKRLFVGRAAESIARRDPVRAEGLAKSTLEDDSLDHVRSLISWACLELGDPDRAERLARSLVGPERRAAALAMVAGQVGRRDPKHGDDLLAAALEAADDLLVIKNAALRDMAVALCGEASSAGWPREQVKQLIAMIGAIPAPTLMTTATRANIPAEDAAVVEIALARALPPEESGEVRELLQSAYSRYDDLGRFQFGQQDGFLKARSCHLVRDTAITMLPIDRDRALNIAGVAPLERSFMRDQIYVAFVPAIALDDPDLADRLAHLIVQVDKRAVALAKVAMAIALSDPAASEAVLVTARRTALAADVRAVHGVAAVVALYDPALAVAILHEDCSESQLSRGLREVSVALAGTDPDRAEQIALSIPDAKERLPALLRLLEP